MQAKDFLVCEFSGDPAKYVGEITQVSGSSFDCRFLGTGDSYTFDSDSMRVTSQFGAIPAGSQLSSYTHFELASTPGFQTGGYVVVTFADGRRLLGQLTDVDASDAKSVTFLDSGDHYVFAGDNTIVSSDGVTQLSAVTALEPYAAEAPVLVVSAAPVGAGSALKTSAAIHGFTPLNRDTIVVNSQEFPSGIASFVNWSTNAALHNSVAKSVRAASSIAFIVLHETSGTDAGTGFDPPFTSHFVIGSNEVRQFNDLCEIEFHATIFNDAGVGIEFKNRDWVAGKDKVAGEDYIDANWSGDYPSYTLPTTDRLENLVLLLQRLLSKNEAGFPAVDPTWLQLVSFNDVSAVWTFAAGDTPDDAKKDLKKFFVYSSGIDFMTPATFASVTGVLSHNSVSDLINHNGTMVVDEDLHTDGSFQALYAWLRIMQSNDVNTAYANARDLVTNHMVKVTTVQQFEGYTHRKGVWAHYSDMANRPVFLIDVETML